MDEEPFFVSAYRAKRRTDCPFKAGTDEWRAWNAVWFEIMYQRELHGGLSVRGDPEVLDQQYERLDRQGRKVVSRLPPKKEHDDPALDVLNVEEGDPISWIAWPEMDQLELEQWQRQNVLKMMFQMDFLTGQGTDIKFTDFQNY